MTTADKLNDCLANGGVVQVTTYTRSTLYGRRNAGCFVDCDGSLFVRRGKQLDRLSHGERVLVGIRCGQYR